MGTSGPGGGRRHTGAAGATLALLVTVGALAACGGSDSGDGARAGDGSGVPADGSGWSFTDDRDVTHRTRRPPDVIVAQSVAAGGLWEYGVEVDGVFGPLRRPDGTADPSLGLADPGSVAANVDDLAPAVEAASTDVG